MKYVKPIEKPEKSLETLVEEFGKRWEEYLTDAETSMNLLLSKAEDDFAGMIEIRDRTFVEMFTDDLGNLLKKANKIGMVRRMKLRVLLEEVEASKSRFKFTDSENLPDRTLVVLEDITGFKRSILNEYGLKCAEFLFERLSHIVNGRYCIVVGTRDELNFFLRQNSMLSMTFGQHRMKLAGMNPETIYRFFLRCLDKDLADKADDAFKEQFEEYIEANAPSLPFYGSELADFLATQSNAARELVLPENIADLMAEPEPEEFSIEQLRAELSEMIGLEVIKEKVEDLAHTVKFIQEARERGMKMPDQALHMVFSGNPGTGKTTIARIVGRMLHSIGVVPTSKFVEVTARDLISPYVGNTAPQTAKVIEDAIGGVLFIDEAYSLVIDKESQSSSHGKEALAELVKAMEDEKEHLVVILAGYTDQMHDLLATNPGMRSRIGYSFEFEDYNPDELTEMYRRKVEKMGFTVESAALDAVREICAHFVHVEDFGNGRFVDRLVQETISEHSKNYTEKTFAVIAASDIPSVERMTRISAASDFK